MATNTQARILELLKRFNRGEKICIDSMKTDSLWEGRDESTIRRDIGAIKEYFPESIGLIRGAKGEKSCYKAITKDMLNNFADSDTLALISQTFSIAQKNSMFENLNISEDEKKIIESKIKKSTDCYKFISKPFETKKSDIKLLKELEKAIHGQRYTTLVNKERNRLVTYKIKPYKIVFINENFYIACENTDDKYPFSMFRLLNITEVKLDTKTFHKNPDIEDFIKEMQTPFSRYKPAFRKHLIEVIVEVTKEKAKFFKLKKFLPSQKIIETKENGILLVSFKVTQEREIKDMIKSWIPHMRVVQPLSLKNEIDEELREYLK